MKNKNRKASYTHQELAMLYFPNAQPESASRQLSRWIMRDEELCTELRQAGYARKQRMYSPMQAAILFDHLGDPENWNLK